MEKIRQEPIMMASQRWTFLEASTSQFLGEFYQICLLDLHIFIYYLSRKTTYIKVAKTARSVSRNQVVLTWVDTLLCWINLWNYRYIHSISSVPSSNVLRKIHLYQNKNTTPKRISSHCIILVHVLRLLANNLGQTY